MRRPTAGRALPAGAGLGKEQVRDAGTHRKRGSRWAFVIDDVKHEDGRRRQRWHSGFRTKREAEEALARAVSQFQDGAYIATNG